MTRRTSASFALLRLVGALSFLLLAQCTEPARRSQLQVRIDADAEVRAQVAQVDVLVEVEDSQGSWQTLRMARFRPNAERPWPLTLRLTLDGARDAEAYQLTATARDANGAFLLRGQATRAAQPNRGITLEVFFEVACIDELCGESRTCMAGMCVSSEREPSPPNRTSDAGPAADSSTPPSPRETTGVQSAGQACGEAGARSCAGRGSRRPLSCDGQRWNEEAECTEFERCDASEGPDRGHCRPIARECAGQRANVQFCDGDTMRVCPDLVASEPRTCGEHERCVEVEGKAVCGCALGFVDKGVGCQPATDCETDNGGCDRQTACSLTRGGERSCGPCPEGHAGSGSSGCSPRLQALESSSGTWSPALAADSFEYRIEVPLVAQRITLTPRGPAGSRVEIAGRELADGRWTSPPLSFGDNVFELHVFSASELRTTYQLTVVRSGRQEAFVKASNPDEYDQYGMTVALSGDTLAVGALYEDSAATGVDGDQSSEAAADSGAVYVYARDDAGWQQQAYLKASEVARDDFFGRAVALSGDTLAVGATRDASSSSATARSGVVYVFERSGGSWTQTARLAASTPSAADEFGASLALTADRLVVGAPRSGAGRGGAVFVFEREAAGWSETKRLEARTPVAGSRFGAAVSLHENRIAVGAPEDGSDAARGGSAHLFLLEGADWNEEKRLAPAAPSEGATFGFSVAVHGERVVVGAPRGVRVPDFDPHPRGETYTFTREGSEWRQVAILEAPRPDQDDFFGVSVALDGDSLLVGSNGEAGGGRGLMAELTRSDAAYAGAAFLFTWGEPGWVRTAYLKADNAGKDHGFGYSVALDRDRIAVGALFEPSDARGVNASSSDRKLQNAGAAYVFR